MKILITAASTGIEADVDPHFGRGAYFCVVDTETMMGESLVNPAANAAGGAGIQAAQVAAGLGAAAVISGHFGPQAADVLNAAKIPMYLLKDSRTVREAADNFIAGKLEKFA